MKILKIGVIIIGLVLMLFFLKIATNKDDQNLGSGYYFLPNYEAIDVGYPYGNLIYKSNNKNHFDIILIRSDIKSVNYNDQFIIVYQEPNKKLALKEISDMLILWNNYYNEIKRDSLINLEYEKASLSDINRMIGGKNNEQITRITDSIFSSEESYKKVFANKYNYYIIDKVNNTISEPLSLKEFNKKKKEKNIDLEFEQLSD